MKWLDGITDSMDMSLSKLRDSGGQRSLGVAVHGVAKSWTLSDLATEQQPYLSPYRELSACPSQQSQHHLESPGVARPVPGTSCAR